MWTNDKYLSETFIRIPECAFILCNGYEEIIGFNYDANKMPRIILGCKYSDTYIVKKLAYEYGVPCYEDKILTHSIARNISDDWDYDDKFVKAIEHYYKYATLKKIYSPTEELINRIEKCFYKKNETEKFNDELNRDVLYQLYCVERNWLKKYSRKAFKKIEWIPVLKAMDAKMGVKHFLEKLQELAEKYNMSVHEENKLFEHELLLKRNNDYWVSKNFYVFINESEEYIKICNRYLSVEFNLNECIRALCWLKSVLNENLKKQKQEIEKFKSKHFINQKNYELGS